MDAVGLSRLRLNVFFILIDIVIVASLISLNHNRPLAVALGVAAMIPAPLSPSVHS